MPEQFVIRLQLGVALPRQNFLMFFPGDAPLSFELNGASAFSGRIGHSTKTYQGQILQTAQKDILYTLLPFWRTRRKCSVVGQQVKSSLYPASSRMARVQRSKVAPFLVFAVSSITHCHVRVEIGNPWRPDTPAQFGQSMAGCCSASFLECRSRSATFDPWFSDWIAFP